MNSIRVFLVVVTLAVFTLFTFQINFPPARAGTERFKALMENPGRVMSRDKLEARIYGWGEELASNSIEVHIHNLRKKIPAGFIKTIRGVGYSIQER